ncbi:MAG: septation protein SpoVG family protein [Alphaproteobacteria bacterium]
MLPSPSPIRASFGATQRLVLDDCLVIDDLKIIERDGGLLVSMPSRKRQDGTFADTVHPTNVQTREMIERSVLAEYQRVPENSKQSVSRRA